MPDCRKDPEEDSWLDAPGRCGPVPRFNPLLTWVDDGIIVWGGGTFCASATDHASCEAEAQRAFYLPAPALFGDVHDAGECTCPPPLEY